MDIQFYGANCISIQHKSSRVIIDDNLDELGQKSITKAEDVALLTNGDKKSKARLTFNSPGEYEVSEISITGIPARSHIEEDKQSATMFKITTGEQNILITGHIYPELSEEQLESIGIVDIMLVPVGGNGYTVDPIGALKLVKAIEPKIVIPTHFADKNLKFEVPQKTLEEALVDLAMEPKDTLTKLKIKPAEMSDITQLIILNKA